MLVLYFSRYIHTLLLAPGETGYTQTGIGPFHPFSPPYCHAYLYIGRFILCPRWQT
jgi:hypothetical protein